ncbi:MAG TPA: hypothetical protein VEP30_09970 [Chthoniobacterales bacterium]|nr:hypothetical protein [Chthoniobacterales bacterium]
MTQIAWAIAGALFLVALTSCATTSTHQFAEPARDWQTRTGQLLYRNPKTTVIGDVFVRLSKASDFELTFSKGPALTLLVLRQDATFAEIKGPLAGRGWSGPIERAPQQLRGWLQLRDKIIHALATASLSGGGQDRHQVRHVSGSETFLFRF